MKTWPHELEEGLKDKRKGFAFLRGGSACEREREREVKVLVWFRAQGNREPDWFSLGQVVEERNIGGGERERENVVVSFRVFRFLVFFVLIVQFLAHNHLLRCLFLLEAFQQTDGPSKILKKSTVK